MGNALRVGGHTSCKMLVPVQRVVMVTIVIGTTLTTKLNLETTWHPKQNALVWPILEALGQLDIHSVLRVYYRKTAKMYTK